MKQFSYVLTSPNGLHPRPLGGLTKEVSRFSSRVCLSSGEKTAAIGDTSAVLSLGLACGSAVKVTIEGRDEEAALAAVQNYFVANL